MPATGVEARRPGRPRSAEADEAILAAAVDLFAECGFDGMTVEGVAARAGVGKGTIYRRYPGKLDLIIAASRYFAQEREPAVDTGTIAGDLRALIDWLIGVFTSSPVGTAMPMMVAERAPHPRARGRARRDRRDEARAQPRRHRARASTAASSAPTSIPSW